MKAVGYYKSLPITDPDAFMDLELPEPKPEPHDLLVEVRAVSVNPVDMKQRKRAAPPEGQALVLGYDAAGVVKAVGAEVTLFKPGDEVWYAGSIKRSGCDAQLHCVDERLVGHKPASLDFAHAAALPLTAITAWELLFEKLGVPRTTEPSGKTFLIVGAAGGVGSILVQVARQLTGLTVIGTASRRETSEAVFSQGAHYVIDHSKPLVHELERIGLKQVDYAAGLTHTPEHFPEIAQALAPLGKFAMIDEFGQNDINLLRSKSASFSWEYMFARSTFQTPDMLVQHQILEEVSKLVDAGTLRTTMTEDLGTINAEHLIEAHKRIESGKTIGKMVLSGW